MAQPGALDLPNQDVSTLGFISRVKAQTDLIEFTADGYVKSDQQFPVGAVVADAGNGALTFKTDLTESTDDVHKGKYLKFTSGALINQIKKVSAYVGSTKIITVSSAFTGTPTATDAFELIDQ